MSYLFLTIIYALSSIKDNTICNKIFNSKDNKLESEDFKYKLNNTKNINRDDIKKMNIKKYK